MRVFQQRKQNISEKDYVIAHFWPQTDRNSAGHVSLEIVNDGKKHHVSYWHQRDIEQCKKDKLKTQYHGVEPFWVNTFEEDCLIEGYRHYSADNPQLNARDILQKCRETQFHAPMQPVQSIKLFFLNIGKMLKAFSEYKANAHKWAFFSGWQHHAEGAHNCSSIVLFLLHEGGIEPLVTSYAESLRNVVLIISVMTSVFWASSIFKLCALTLLSGLAGSAVGGGIDGYQDVQPFMRVLEITKKDSFAAKTGITLSAILMSSILAVLQNTHYFVSRFTLPGNVLAIVMQAAQAVISAINHVMQSEPVFSATI